MSQSQLDPHRFAMQLARLSRSWRAELDRRLVGLGLSQARWLVLLHLSRFEELPTQRELAQSVGVEGPTLARLLDSLEAQGLVSRQAVPEDRRAKKISLSPPAQPLIEKIEAISTQLRKELFAGIDEEELRRCQLVHARILSNLEKH
ncbi:MAG: MarR family transcriptional regulator [Pseudomonas sp.]|nr:MarR family transcriptional regulator [Pseudomonas sp.]